MINETAWIVLPMPISSPRSPPFHSDCSCLIIQSKPSSWKDLSFRVIVSGCVAWEGCITETALRSSHIVLISGCAFSNLRRSLTAWYASVPVQCKIQVQFTLGSIWSSRNRRLPPGRRLATWALLEAVDVVATAAEAVTMSFTSEALSSS